MATAVQKITLSSSRDIPFNKLVLSQSNVRRVKAGVSIEQPAEDIARRTLLQSLNVRPILDAESIETGMFEVPAGGRRYRALQLLVKQKRLAKTAPVPCVVRDPSADISTLEDSLAENVHRASLHPLDQFRAFQALRQKGQSEEEIAAAFFVGVNVVKQRLRLATVSKKLLDIYAEDGMSLEQLMAFTVTNDHARQEQLWEALQHSYSQEPYQIRRMLTERTVRASDRRALFVGIDAYEQAGGAVVRDLFQQDDGGWLKNIGLLDTLVAEKLKAGAHKIAPEGWKWIEVNVHFPFGHTHHLRELEGTPTDLTIEEQATIEALKAEYAIRLAEGILLATYATLRTDERGEKLSRVRQIVEWLGSGFDGVIIFDESHAMQNAVGGKGKRGDQAPSQQGRAGLRLQHALSNARVVYVSATGATTVHNLAYAQRLGLWGGEDFPFATRAEFVEAIEDGGVAAMEVLARDLKALGLYAARSLSYEGVEYELVEHQLTPDQIRIYNAYAGASSIIHNNLDAAMRAANITGETGTLNAQAKSAALSAFESAKQRFFGHLLTSMKTPSLIISIECDLEAGHAAVNDTMRDQLKAYGHFHEIISWKLRMFVPTDPSGVAILARVLEHYPVERISEREAA